MLCPSLDRLPPMAYSSSHLAIPPAYRWASGLVLSADGDENGDEKSDRGAGFVRVPTFLTFPVRSSKNPVQSSPGTDRRNDITGFRGGMECSSDCLLDTSSVLCCVVIAAGAQRRAGIHPPCVFRQWD